MSIPGVRFLWFLSLLVVFVGGALLETCQSKGFDPTRLSCDTCQVLKEYKDLFGTCRECCQTYHSLDRKKLTSRYPAAVLVYMVEDQDTGDSGIKTFVEEHAKSLQSTKKSFRVLKKQSDMGSYRMMGTPSILYFFSNAGEAIPANPRDYPVHAKESIVLNGWDKEDINDMLDTLLQDK
eukprot:CAMPEP_0116826576 /NCGR_PEP_ID=MMETSP0418-20121206/2603_1 /TAXON_ID=1158023 /ORGANISM="Astrosyne radiata, Strain 13vi08-1A" /LENGTH=178 /DNA_ID=CAMNT_0004455221 /DNA_START=13 /DNA_END=549 /DNA_ORIENTATION=+